MTKPLFDKTRPLSWSAISSFEYDPEQWYKKYVLKQEQPTSPEMEFGKAFAQSIEDGKCKVPILMQMLQDKKEHEFKVVFGGIKLVGYADAFCDKTFRKLDEVKTGKKAWDKKRADEHGQIDMYLLMNYITNKVKPDDVECTIYWIPTQDNGDFTITFVEPVRVHAFKTKRTMVQVLKFGERIKATVKKMEQYALNHA
jgi:hypothetical protein